MIEIARDIVGGLFLASGAGFFLIGAIGLHRMPELFSRIHAASLADTTGVGLILIGLMIHGGFSLVTVKLVFLLLFMLFMGPVATHALAAAALQAGLKPGLPTTRKQVAARATRKVASHAAKPRKGRGKA